MWFDERLYSNEDGPGYAQRFRVSSMVYEADTDFQELVIFDTAAFGRVLALDGVIQTTEGDEFVYHEMLAHVPIFAHGAVRRVLIVGGGDGGALREVLRHPTVEQAVMVELDRTVVDLCREYMPSLSAGAFDDPRAELVITDGVKFMAETDRRFDVIIVDSTDPIGPGEVLFTSAFYADCRRCLTPGGVLVTQNGVPMMQPREVTTTHRRLAPIFADASFYVAVVPTYVGGMMTLAWASDNAALRRQTVADIAPRVAAAGLDLRYYTAGLHVGAFALPGYISRLMD
ncbi:MAG: polyamine aminopropyltransferase [Hyphomicrobiales bacterium]|nr:polyamine aminopropyltransferase [Hyphomicrobiales bacterium]MCP5373602.1 polyamine aminopropyltransferase [Hyphomicrobiales bacterium]